MDSVFHFDPFSVQDSGQEVTFFIYFFRDQHKAHEIRLIREGPLFRRNIFKHQKRPYIPWIFVLEKFVQI